MKVPASPELGVVIDKAEETVNDLDTWGAAIKIVLPAWFALIVQVPGAFKVTAVPETVQIPVVPEEKATVNPLDAVAATVKVPVPMVRGDKGLNVIV